ncbi:MAG: amidohydrolase [Eubacteriaceae bacterium]|nr:amidohydrolase [Eubacteriaceae bacterium]
MKLLKNVRLYTGEEYFERGAVAFDDGGIVYAGAQSALTDGLRADVIDGRGGLCMPPMVNAHTHAAMVLLRGVASDENLNDWLDKVVPIEEMYTPQMIHDGTMLAIAQMIRTGTSAFADMYYHMHSVIDAVLETGIRANITRGSSSREGVDSHVSWFKDHDGAANGNLRVYMGIHAEYTSDEDIVSYAADTAASLGTGIHVHVSESAYEVAGCVERHGCSPVEYFDRLGVFDLPTIAAHCVHLTGSDIALLGSKHVNIAHCPLSNLKLGNGIAPVRDLMGSGAAIAVGTDGASSNNSLDMFRETKAMSLLAKGSLNDPKAMSAEESLRCASLNGYRALGFGNAGLIKAGMDADMIVLDSASFNMFPGVDPAADAVYSATGEDVILNIVNGKVLYAFGEFKTLDIDKVRKEAYATARELGIV